MGSKVLSFVLVMSLLLNLLLGMMVLGMRSYRGMDQARWKRQSRMVVDWAERVAKEKRSFTEVSRLTGNSEASDVLHWGPDHDDVWTIMFESDDAGKVVDVKIDGYTVQEFRDIYAWLKDERR